MLKVARQLRAGVVWANTFNEFDPASPFWRVPGIRMGPRGRSPRPSRLPCLIVCITSRRPYTNVEDNNMTRLGGV